MTNANSLAAGPGVGIASYHPSYVLRVRDRASADKAYGALVDDLRRAVGHAG